MEPLIREQLQKIARLAEAGVAGERETARAMLERLCAKHRISPDSLLSVEKTWEPFQFGDAWEEDLFAQCAMHVLQIGSLSWKRKSKRSRTVYLNVTEAERIDIRACWAHYRKAWKSHLGDALAAFIHKNRIYGSGSAEAADAPLDMARLERILAMMRGMKSEQWSKPVALITS